MNICIDNSVYGEESVSSGDLSVVDSIDTDSADTLTVSEPYAEITVSGSDIEPLITELTGVNNKLSLLLAVVICAVIWKCCTAGYKLFDMFF